MKLVLACAFVFLVYGCTTNAPVVSEYMIIAPHSIAMTAARPDSTVSITHSCTCPFTWNSTIIPASPWLTFPTYQNGDKTDVPISIDTSQLPVGTSHASIIINSNSYGEDSILVTVSK